MATKNIIEKIFRVWSERQEDEIAVRIQFSIADAGGCRVFEIATREEWV
ncbi:MAG: hypothetical protein H7Y20_01800 [Bryobacteraceae bacterium]|nr:hypothetical protein [Bryobacteraceae bacterium]